MPEVAISALTAATGLTDDDVLIVNDGATTKKITAANAGNYQFSRGVISGTRLDAAGTYVLTRGPWDANESSTILSSGKMFLGLSHVVGGTPTTVSIEINSASSGDSMYYVMYNVDEELMPTTLAYSWGPFSTTSTGMVSLTGQSTAITAGLYLCGAFSPSSNSGAPAANGFLPTLPLLGIYELTGVGATRTYTGSGHSTTPPADLSAEVMRGNPPSTTNNYVAILMGD